MPTLRPNDGGRSISAPYRRGGVLLRPNDPKRKGVRIARRRFYSVPVNQEHHCYEPWLPTGERRPRYLYETYEDALADARYAALNDEDEYT